MSYQMIFKRYEMKYFLTRQQQKELLKVMKPYMRPDDFGHTVIRNLYFDTDNYRLIRRSLEKPVYKEKLRIRSYHKADPDSTVFVELKKKYRSVVYKRRVALSEKEALGWICEGNYCLKHSQIAKEIEYFRTFYNTLRPACLLSYERDAYYALSGDGFRITFDSHIIGRGEDLSLDSDVWGTQLLEEGKVLMEVKTAGGIPMWLTDFMTKNQIYKTSFSKYGEAYCREIKQDYPYIRCVG